LSHIMHLWNIGFSIWSADSSRVVKRLGFTMLDVFCGVGGFLLVRVRRLSRFCYGISSLPVLAREDDDMPMIENARHCRLAFQESKKISENGTCAYVCECVYCLSSSLLRTIRSDTQSLTHTYTPH
jgi:hypothetical protein